MIARGICVGMRFVYRIVFWIIKFPFILMKIMYNYYKRGYMRRTYMDLEDLVDAFQNNPIDFESYVAKVYEKYGFSATVTQASNDRGKDIEMWYGDEKYVVEVKLYEASYRVSREKIQKLHSAMIDSEADRAIFVTTSDFSRNAVEYAEKHGIDLVNGMEFIHLING